jgi:glycosyltransferase involved in cell wall biosynthesis
MKIGIDIRLIGKKRTGDEAVIFNLVKNLAKIDDKNEYLLLTDNNNEAELEKISKDLRIENKNNFKIISLPLSGRFAWNLWILPMYLRKNPVNIYHTQYITPWFVPKSVKIVTIIHDISFNFFPQLISFSDLFFLKTLIPMSLKRADKIIAVSQFTKDEIIKFYKINPEKIECVYNSIGSEFLSDAVSEEKLKEVRNKYGLPEKFILYMGTLQPRKNIPQLIEAFGLIKSKLWDFKLVICGNKNAHNYDQKIEASIEASKLENDIIFPGFIDENDKQAVFRSAHVFAFPSLYEGFGIPVLEAMSQGVPIICSDIPSLKEIAGSGALYFDVSSMDDLSQKLYAICSNNDLREKLIRSGNVRVGFFSWEKSAREMLAIYEKL